MAEEIVESKPDEVVPKVLEGVTPEGSTGENQKSEASKRVLGDAGKTVPVAPDPAKRAAAVQLARELNRERNVRREKAGAGGTIFMFVAVTICVMLLLCFGLFLLSFLVPLFVPR